MHTSNNTALGGSTYELNSSAPMKEANNGMVKPMTMERMEKNSTMLSDLCGWKEDGHATKRATKKMHHGK